MTAKTIRKYFAAILSVMLMLTTMNGVSPIVYAEEKDSKLAFQSVGESEVGKTYYVDGENGDNTLDGLTPQTAWKDFEKVNATTFEAGDHILLHAQSTWNNTLLHPKGNGNEEHRIFIDFYDTDSKGNAVYESDTRPVINGNGTYSTGTFKRAISGAVQLVNQEYWTISNLEVTNSPDLDNQEAYLKPGDAQRAGILVLGYEQDRTFNKITVRNNYVHDVQTEYYLNFSGNRETKRLKAVGGIIVLGAWFDEDGNVTLNQGDHRSTTGFDDVLIENNIVQRVGLEGIRTKADSDTSVANTFHKTLSNIVIRNNYLEDVAGDGIVLSEIKHGGVVDGNVAVRVSNADYGTHNYAGVWAMSVDGGLFENNEVYGIQYGYNDGEAFDIDMGSNNVVYQYNYSHHNTGGFMLLMSDQRDSIIRYNVSANDGGGNRGTKAHNPGGTGGSYEYKEQSIFHYWVKSDGRAMPQIHNNTFYVGDGISTSLYGEGNSSDNSGTVAHFHNNILYKEGEGQLRFLTNYPNQGQDPTERKMVDNPEDYIKNNVIWPASIASEKSGATVEKLEAAGNIIANPKLAITDNPELVKELANQEFTTMDIANDDIKAFTSKERLRDRASLFMLTEDSPAIAKGLSSSNTIDKDFFGTDLTNKAVDIGFHQYSNIERIISYKDVELELLTATGVYPSLPTSLAIEFTETVQGEEVATATKNFDIQWDRITKEQLSTPGTIEVKGHAVGLDDSDVSIVAKVTFAGELGEGKDSLAFDASQTAFVQKSDGNKAYSADAGTTGNVGAKEQYKHPYGSTSFGGNYVLKMKNAGAAAYNRRIYVEIDTEHLDDYKDLKNASLQLRVTRYDAWSGAGSSDDSRLRNTQFKMNVYAVDSNWTKDTITWNNGPGNGDTPTAPLVASNTFTNGNIIDNDNIINIDISSYMLSLLQEGGELPDKVSFLLAIDGSNLPGYNPDNSGFDAFSTEGAAKAFELYQEGKLTLPAGHDQNMDAKTLAPKIVFTNVYETGYEDINLEVEAGTAPTLPETVTINYSNGSSKDVSVNWPTVDPNLYSKAGVFEVVGYADGISTPIVATVTVTTKSIVSFKDLEVLDRFAGTTRFELELPTEVTAVLNDESELVIPVIAWDDDVSNYSPTSEPGTYSFPAAIELPVGIENPSDLKAAQTVRTHAEPETITFNNEEVISIQATDSHQISATVVGKAPFTETDAYSSQLTYQLVDTQAETRADVLDTVVLPEVDENGLITTTLATTPGTYDITVSSAVKEGVSANFTFEVVEFEDIDLTELENLVKDAEALSLDGRPQTLIDALKAAIQAAKDVIENTEATQEDINKVFASLKEAVSNIENFVDKTALETLVSEAEAKDLTIYTDETAQAVVDAITAAKLVVANDDATEVEVNTALDALQEALDNLVEKAPVVDKTALEALINEAEAKDTSTYTAESVELFDAALSAAQAVLANDAATQAEVNNAILVLQSAIDNLVTKDPVVSVDKSKLEALIKEVEGKDTSAYTEASVKALNTAIANAKAVLANDDATQGEVNAALTALQEAVDGLVKKDTTPTEPTKPTVPKDDKEQPATGIESNNGLYAILVIGVSALALMLLRKRKQA